jgi:hypothetical protein
VKHKANINNFVLFHFLAYDLDDIPVHIFLEHPTLNSTILPLSVGREGVKVVESKLFCFLFSTYNLENVP